VRVAAPLAFAELVRAPAKTAVRVLTLAAAVGLLAAMLLFVGHSLGTTPAVLLCDEPTGLLDSDTQTRVLELLDALQREFQFALVVATHDAEVAARYDTVVELHDGRVVAEMGVL